MIARALEPFKNCHVFHTSGNLIRADEIVITGNFFATCGEISVAGIYAEGDIILDADCLKDGNFISAGCLHAGGKIIIRNFENDVQEMTAEKGIFFSFDGPCSILDSDVNKDVFEDDFADDSDGEYSIQECK